MAEARARVMHVGLGRIAGRRGEASAEFPAAIMLGNCTLPGDVGPYEPTLLDGDADREGVPSASCSWIGDGIDPSIVGECPPVDDPEDIEVVRFRRLLPWLS